MRFGHTENGTHFVSISRSLHTREIPASSSAFMEIRRIQRSQASCSRFIRAETRFPQRGNTHHTVYDHELCDFRATPRREIATRQLAAVCLSTPKQRRWRSLRVVRFLVNSSQPSQEPGADVAPDEAKTSFFHPAQSLPGAVCKRRTSLRGFLLAGLGL